MSNSAPGGNCGNVHLAFSVREHLKAIDDKALEDLRVRLIPIPKRTRLRALANGDGPLDPTLVESLTVALGLRNSPVQTTGAAWKLCLPRTNSELAEAASIVGASLRLGVESAVKLEYRKRTAGHKPVAPHQENFDAEAWSLLQVMLVEERRLIEFLRGPIKGGHEDDICVNCFASKSSGAWTAIDGDKMTTLRARSLRINKRVTHLSWTLAQPDDFRTRFGSWRTGYIRLIAEEILQFANWLSQQEAEIGSKLLAAAQDAVRAARTLPTEVE